MTNDVRYVAFEHHSWKKHGTKQTSVVKDMYQSADPVRYPLIANLKEELFSGEVAENERFRWGLEVILRGMMQTPIP
ncbi:MULTISPECIES: hypothetical protein [unclassified Paenibacillus]|uniref:hypothetical protein n=1 Tax=unclassified Paenibacillus TaxID=185978 RepID=UPI001C0F8AC9|nr:MULTISPECIES: hypothetical protein [unclassified Paenibacillus]MBU5445045.1 hypothetical protein [Paenibacillus sp. MSJ-34]